MRYLWLFAMAVCFGGCASIEDTKLVTNQALENIDSGWRYTRTKIETMAGIQQPVAVAQKEPSDTGYCYRTWGQVDCYEMPQDGQDYRMVGYVPRPRGVMLAEQALTDTVDRMASEVAAERSKAAQERAQKMKAAAKAAEEKKIASIPGPKTKPGYGETGVDPLDLIRFQLGDSEFSTKDMPKQEDLNF